MLDPYLWRTELKSMAEATLKTYLPYLSPAEFRIYSLLSKQGPLTIREIRMQLSRLDPALTQSYNTVGTLLERLMDKGYVEQHDQGGRAHVFRPTIPYDFALRLHVARFLDAFLISSSRADLRALLEIVADRLIESPL